METLTTTEHQLLVQLGTRLNLPLLERRQVLHELLATLAAAMAGTCRPDDPLLDACFATDEPPGPALLSALVETYGSERHSSGSYYTPRLLVEGMCRLALAVRLESGLPGETPTTITALLQHHDASAMQDPAAALALLDQLQICDPACGSGAYLVGMVHVLAAAQTALRQRLDLALPPDLLQHIADRNLFGVDIDPLAVDCCRRRLDLLAGATGRSRADRLVCGDSLASTAAAGFAWPQAFPAVFAAGGFDIVITNPPYLSCKHGFGRNSRAELARHFRSARGQFDAWMLFLERSLELLAPDGCYAYLVPRPLLANSNVRPLRELLTTRRIVALADPGPVFAAGVEPLVLLGQQADQADRPVQIYDWRTQPGATPLLLRPLHAFVSAAGTWNISRLAEPASDEQRMDRLPRLGDMSRLLRGAECGKRDPTIGSDPVPEAFPLLRGADVRPFQVRYAGLYIRRAGEERRYKPLTIQNAPKLLVRRVAGNIIAALDEHGRHGLNTLYIILPHEQSVWLSAYLCGLLNSEVLNRYFSAHFQNRDRLFPYLRMEQLASLPIAVAEPAQRDQIVGLVRQLHRRYDPLVRAQLETLVQALYADDPVPGAGLTVPDLHT